MSDTKKPTHGSGLLEEGIAVDFINDPENMPYPHIGTAQADMFQELGTTSPETTLTYTVDESKIAASGLNDTGLREDAPSGATREPTTGKGAFHLVTPAVVDALSTNISDYDIDKEEATEDINNILAMAIRNAYKWLATNEIFYLEWALDNIVLACAHESGEHGYANALMRLARHYENGAAKYDARNWEKGLSSARCFDSGIRHMVRYINNDRSEDHLAAALWNLAGIKHYLMFGHYDTIDGVRDLTMPWRGTLKEGR